MIKVVMLEHKAVRSDYVVALKPYLHSETGAPLVKVELAGGFTAVASGHLTEVASLLGMEVREHDVQQDRIRKAAVDFSAKLAACQVTGLSEEAHDAWDVLSDALEDSR